MSVVTIGYEEGNRTIVPFTIIEDEKYKTSVVKLYQNRLVNITRHSTDLTVVNLPVTPNNCRSRIWKITKWSKEEELITRHTRLDKIRFNSNSYNSLVEANPSLPTRNDNHYDDDDEEGTSFDITTQNPGCFKIRQSNFGIIKNTRQNPRIIRR